jgi:hypothetical protein
MFVPFIRDHKVYHDVPRSPLFILHSPSQVYNLTAPAGVPASSMTGLAAQPCPDPKVNPTSVGQVCAPLLIEKITSSYTTVGIVAIVFAFLQVPRSSPAW